MLTSDQTVLSFMKFYSKYVFRGYPDFIINCPLLALSGWLQMQIHGHAKFGHSTYRNVNVICIIDYVGHKLKEDISIYTCVYAHKLGMPSLQKTF